MKHRNIAAAAISAVLGLMSLALSAKESYIGTDSTIVVRDYIANMEYVNGVLERVNFEGGYIDMTGESPRYMYYETDHLGNVRAVVDEDGNVCQVNHYYPYGDRIDDSRDISAEGSDNMRLFGGKEYSEDTGLHDFEARYDNTLFGRFTTLDPMAEKYYSVSPYSYCAGNPVNFVDPSGMDRYSIDENGVIIFIEARDEDYDELYAAGDDTKSVVIRDRSVLPSLLSGYAPVSSSKEDVMGVFFFAADSFNKYEWGLYSDGNRYALRTDRSNDSVHSPFEYFLEKDEYGPQADITKWKIHSHSDTPDNERLELESMGYWVNDMNAFDNNGYLKNRHVSWSRSPYGSNDISNFINTGITSLVYFPISHSIYTITPHSIPRREKVK